MPNGKNKDAFDELDDFWELDALLPPKAMPPSRTADVETVEVSLGEKSYEGGYERYEAKTGGSIPPRSTASSSTKDERKYPPITSSYASRSGKKIDYSAWLQRRRDGEGSVVNGGGNDEVFEYVPENPLIFRVKVIRRRDFDGIEERSLSDMKLMAEETEIFTENVEFTALFPQ